MGVFVSCFHYRFSSLKHSQQAEVTIPIMLYVQTVIPVPKFWSREKGQSPEKWHLKFDVLVAAASVSKSELIYCLEVHMPAVMKGFVTAFLQ